jgi:cyanophycinase-like exopeptidase
MLDSIGPIALLGSGETSLAGGRIYEMLAGRYSGPLQVAVLETPAGFEINSAQVAGRVAEYLKVRLQNFAPKVQVVPARRRDGPWSTEDPAVLQPLLTADLIFMGPGSPTYAVRQLRGTLAWDLLRARHRSGATLIFASAATVAIGAHSLPVYEIYKVGEDVSCPPGLDLFGDFGLSVSCIPHWNNTDGGADVDTSRCFIGMERFAQWCDMLPAGSSLLGLDEHTGVVIDPVAGTCLVSGVSSVTLLQECTPQIYPAGQSFSLTELGPYRLPEDPAQGIRDAAWELIRQAQAPREAEQTPEAVLQLLEKRRLARQEKDWAASDRLRAEIAQLGWTVQDTAAGQTVSRNT